MEPICGYLLQTTTSAAADLRLDRQGKYTEIEKTWENTFQLHNWWIRLLTFAKRSRTVSPIFFDYLIIPLGISCRIRWVELHPVILYLGVPLRLGSGEGCVFFSWLRVSNSSLGGPRFVSGSAGYIWGWGQIMLQWFNHSVRMTQTRAWGFMGFKVCTMLKCTRSNQAIVSIKSRFVQCEDWGALIYHLVICDIAMENQL
jgi:hypothetical protein